MAASSHVVIVGGGAFGRCVAFYLAQAGVRTTVLEPDGFRAHASGNNAGKLNPILGSAPALIPLALASFARHGELARELAELGAPEYGLKRTNRFLLAMDESEVANLEATERLFARYPDFAATPVSADALLRLEPRVSAAIRSALLLEGNMSLDGGAFLRALDHGATRLGAMALPVRASGIELAGERVTAVLTPEGRMDCDAVVLATGPWIRDTAKWLGFELSITAVKGQMLRVRMPGPPFAHDFTRGPVTLYGRSQGEVWLGVTEEHTGLDATPTAAGKELLFEAASAIVPSVTQAAVVEHTAALRPISASGLPILGPVPGVNNAFIANGGGRKGMLLAPFVGACIRDVVLGQSQVPAELLPEGRA